MHCLWALRAAIGDRCGNHLGYRGGNEGSERLSSWFKITQSGYKARWYQGKCPTMRSEIWVRMSALLS